MTSSCHRSPEVTQALGRDGEPLAEFSWEPLPNGELLVTVPIDSTACAKQCCVTAKRNWLTVWAPPPRPVPSSETCSVTDPPENPLLDMQLYGAVDVGETMWELTGTGARRSLLITLRRAPIYMWPTLHRVDGLKREADRPAVLACEKAAWEARNDAAAKAAAAAAMAADSEDSDLTGMDHVWTGVAAHPGAVFGPKASPNLNHQPHYPKCNAPQVSVGAQQPPGVYERGRVIVAESASDLP